MKALFSIYLSDDPFYDGKITFSGYDLFTYAKEGAFEGDIEWF